jgi:hypothetical protein
LTVSVFENRNWISGGRIWIGGGRTLFNSWIIQSNNPAASMMPKSSPGASGAPLAGKFAVEDNSATEDSPLALVLL